MAALAFATLVCIMFVGLTRLALTLPPHVMDAVLLGLGFFTLPCLLIYPPAALLWGAALLAGWSFSDSARIRRLRVDTLRVPDAVPEEWRIS